MLKVSSISGPSHSTINTPKPSELNYRFRTLSLECFIRPSVHSISQCRLQTIQNCDQSYHTALFYSVTVHFQYFSAYSRHAIICAAVSNCVLQGNLLKLFTACSTLRNVRQKTSLDEHSFTDCSISSRACHQFSA